MYSMIWFILLILGTLTYLSYFIVQRSVAHITKTPIWILWLVMMTPAFVWTAWVMIHGEEPIPLLLLVGPFVVSSVLYWFLVQWGRPAQPSLPSESQAHSPEKQDALNAVIEKRPALHPINKEDEANIHNCFPWTVYWLQDIKPERQIVICRGQLRASPEVAYNTVRDNIEAHFGDRFLVVFQEGLNGKPFFVLVPNPRAKTTTNSTVTDHYFRPGIALGLLVATLITTTFAGAMMMSAEQEIAWNVSTLLTGIPYALALMTVLGIHELGHYLAACHYRIRATLPYFIPVPPATIFPFGTFGAFIQLRSPIPNRKALFDVGIAGPLTGFIITIPILLWGLAHSTPTPIMEESGILNFESFRPTASLLLAILSKLALGSELTATSAIKLHPVAIAGCLGMIITALNLMPVGQLDGGHIVHAMFGQRTGAVIGQFCRLLVLALSFAQKEFLLWAILLFFMPVVDEPALNDVSELDNGRDFLGLLALCLLVVIILPAPQAITQMLF
ncbi:MAG: site-2 protease family protein [Cyanobacteria bacterium RU_5_0]|nr:site-2 protease family protein [Cyanobacteria bacterium RU_5_0]